MKKRTSFFYISLALLSIAFLSCKLKMEEEELYDKPSVNLTPNQLTVIIPHVSNDIKYVNVYRRDKLNDEIINIGILYNPQALQDKNYVYIDSLVTRRHSYDYRVRYNIGGSYHYSEWSDSVFIEDTYNLRYVESIHLVYRANAAHITYEPTDYTLNFSGTINPPDFDEFLTENYKPMLIVQSDKYTQAFAIPTTCMDSNSNNRIIALRSLLPAAFLDTNIKINGIVAQKTIYDDESKPEDERQYKMVIWTAPTELELLGAGSSRTINIPSQTGTAGLDYGRKARKESLNKRQSIMTIEQKL